MLALAYLIVPCFAGKADKPQQIEPSIEILVTTWAERWGSVSVALAARSSRDGWRWWTEFTRDSYADNLHPSSHKTCTVEEEVPKDAAAALDALVAYVPTEHERRGGSGGVLIVRSPGEGGQPQRIRVGCTIDEATAEAGSLCARVQAVVTTYLGVACDPTQGPCPDRVTPPADPMKPVPMPLSRIEGRFETRALGLARRDCGED